MIVTRDPVVFQFSKWKYESSRFTHCARISWWEGEKLFFFLGMQQTSCIQSRLHWGRQIGRQISRGYSRYFHIQVCTRCCEFSSSCQETCPLACEVLHLLPWPWWWPSSNRSFPPLLDWWCSGIRTVPIELEIGLVCIDTSIARYRAISNYTAVINNAVSCSRV